MLKQQALEGRLKPGKQGGGMKGELEGCSTQLTKMVEQDPDATLPEYCEYWRETHNQWLSPSTVCRALQKAQLTRKKSLYEALKPQQRSNYGVNTGSK